MIPQINIPPFKDVTFYTKQGKVLSNQKRSDTIVSGNDTSVSSYVRVTTEFWILTEDGKEENIKLYGYDLPVRESHEISVVWGERGKTSEWLYFWNHTADKYYYLENKMWKDLSSWLWAICGIGSALFLVLSLNLLNGNLPNKASKNDELVVLGLAWLATLLCLLGLILISIIAFKNWSNQRELKNYLKTHLNWRD
jgi:hypothetical protein